MHILKTGVIHTYIHTYIRIYIHTYIRKEDTISIQYNAYNIRIKKRAKDGAKDRTLYVYIRYNA